MKHLFIFISVLFIMACANKNYTKRCEDLKKGKFGFLGNGTERRYTIERNDSTQIETDETIGSVTEFNIKWPSPCEYQLTFKRHIKTGSDTSLVNRIYHPVRTTILKIGTDHYIFKSKIDGFDVELIDTMGISKSF